MSSTSILKFKNWHIVPLWFLLSAAFGLAGFLSFHVYDNKWLFILFDLLSGATMLSYPLLVWKGLNILLAGQQRYEKVHPNSVPIILLVMAAAHIVRLSVDVQFVGIASACVSAFGYGFIAVHAGKQMKSILLKRNAGSWEYIPETFQFLLWPLGVLWLQPEINQIAERPVIIRE